MSVNREDWEEDQRFYGRSVDPPYVQGRP